MALNYDRFCLCIAYHLDNRDDEEASEAELYQYNEDCVKTWDADIQSKMREHGIPVTFETKSQVLALAKASGGASISAKVRQACHFFASVRPYRAPYVVLDAPLPPSPAVVAGTATAPGSEAREGPRKRKTRRSRRGAE